MTKPIKKIEYRFLVDVEYYLIHKNDLIYCNLGNVEIVTNENNKHKIKEQLQSVLYNKYKFHVVIYDYSWELVEKIIT